MIYVRVIDENGLFIEDTFVEELTEFTIETPCPSGFYLPRWNGTEWVEGGQAPEPVEPEPQAPTVEEMAIALLQTQTQLEEAQTALDFLIMGGL